MANNQIALLAQAPVLDTPFESQGKALQLRQLMNQGQIQDMDLQARHQALADDAIQRQAYAANPTDGIARLAALSAAPKLYQAEQKAQMDAKKTGADIGHLDAQTKEVSGKALNQAFATHRDQINTVNTPEDAANWVKAGFADPLMAPILARVGTMEQAIKKIPTNQVDLQDWKQQAGLSANEYVKHTSPDANTKLTNQTSITNNINTNATTQRGQNMTAGTAANRLKFDSDQAANSQDEKMDPLAVRMTAQQYLAGDTGALANFGRGAQGAANLNAVRLEISKQANALGLNGADIAAKVAEFAGTKAGQRTAGTRSANIEIAANEVEQLAPLALEASQKVARSGFLPFGKAQIMFDSNSNDPNMRQFAMANTALVNAYGQAMARGGVATVSDKDHARELLSTAFDQPSYSAAIQQLQKETKAAQAAPKSVRKNLSNEVSGRSSESAPAKTNAGATVSNW